MWADSANVIEGTQKNDNTTLSDKLIKEEQMKSLYESNKLKKQNMKEANNSEQIFNTPEFYMKNNTNELSQQSNSSDKMSADFS